MSTNAAVIESADLLAKAEAALDRDYHELPLPHPNKILAVWYLLAVAEDYQRNLFIGLDPGLSAAAIEFRIDRLKYSLRYGLDRILKEVSDQSPAQVPRRIIPMLYERTAKLLFGGLDFIAANQLCSAAHAGTVRFVDHQNEIEVLIDEQHHHKGYAALELMGHEQTNVVDFAALFFAYLRLPENRPQTLQEIALTVRIRNRLVEYEYLQNLAIELAQEIEQPSFLIPDGWAFPWGGRVETTLLLNALSLRCFYHLVAVHFGSLHLALRGGGEANICLVLTPKQLADDLKLMSSLSPKVIAAFIQYLTYGFGTKTPDPALQPIVQLGPDKLALPCIHFLSSNHERNLLSLQARIQQKQYDAMSDLFEKNMVRRLEAQLRDKWPALRVNIELTLDGGNEEIDLLIADVQTCTLLVCELRWMLQPGDPREVQNRKRVCWEKVDQLERKVRWIQQRTGAVLKRAFDVPVDSATSEPWSVIGVVIIETFGGVMSTKPEFPIMTLALFELGMQKATSLVHFGAWSKSLLWLPQEGVNFKLVTLETELAGKKLKSFGMERLQSRSEYREYVTRTFI